MISFEIGLRGPDGYMSDLVEAAKETGKGLGFFCALGDLWPWDDRLIRCDWGDLHTCSHN